MPTPQADRNLLFGILALQLDFINRDALIKAMHAWVLEKTKPLGQILLEQEALSSDTRALLEALVQKHLSRHEDDAAKSLAAVSSVDSIRQDLGKIADPDVQASLVNVSSGLAKNDDPYATGSVGVPTSAGMRFRILRPHAKGGLGEVFIARDEELHREVALKEIQDLHADNQESRSRFMLEAEITGGLEHPGIVPVYGLGTYADGRPYYAMRFIRGNSLQDAIKRHHQGEAGASPGERTLELRKLLGRFIDVCQAIQYAHDRGVLHRDLKPGNIMLGKYGETLVVDWGVAKSLAKSDRLAEAATALEEPKLQPWSVTGTAETVAGAAIGTPAYMSPEQAAGRLDLLGPASDVYSLGATLHAVLTGRSPFEGKDVATVLTNVQRGEFPRPRQLKPDVNAALEAICVKAMALKPEGRYATPRALADDLERWLGDEPVSAMPEPVTAKAARWMRRHKPLVSAAAAAFLVGLIALTAGALWYESQQAEAARTQAAEEAEAVRKQALAQQIVRRGLEQARQTRDDLHKILKQPGGVQTLLNHPARWQAQLKSARADWQRATDHAEAARDPHWKHQLRTLDTELARDQADYDLALRLEKIRLDQATVFHSKSSLHRTTAEYSAAFAEAGLNPTPGRQKEVAQLLQQSAVKDQLLAALDDWAFGEHNSQNNPELVSRLLEIARLTDPDPWRNKVRAPKSWKNQQTIVKLAQEAQKDGSFLVQLSPQMLVVVASLLPAGQEKETWLRTAQALHPADFWISFRLGASLMLEKKDGLEAAGFYRVAIAIRPDTLAAHFSLGFALQTHNDLPAAINAYHKAIALDPNFAPAWTDLGIVLEKQKKLAAAIDAHNQALALDPKFAYGWYNFGHALQEQKDLPAAIDAYKKALALDAKLVLAWFNLGRIYRDRKDLPTAIDAYKKALAVEPTFAFAWYEFGNVLTENKDLPAAIDAYDKALAIEPKWAFAQTKRADAQKLRALDERLPGVLQGEAASAADLLILADFSRRHKEHYRSAVALYAKAFAAEPSAAEQQGDNHRYDAACCAALAAVGKGRDAAKLDAAVRTRLRIQAFDWLKADWTACAKMISQDPVLTHQTMQRWLRDDNLASLHDDKELSKLSADERTAWKQLWGEVERLANQARARYTQTEHKGQLNAKEPERNHPIRLTAGKTYFIDMESPQFDTYLRLEDEKGKVVAENDDISKTNLNSRIVFTVTKDSAYRIVATSYQQRGIGAYTITVREFARRK